MFETLLNLLKQVGGEVYQQGSFTSSSEYPDHFFTFWNENTPAKSNYDNEERSTIWMFTIYYYSINPLKPLEMILKTKKLLKKNGWIVPGKGQDITSDSKKHTGRMIEVYYIEQNKEV